MRKVSSSSAKTQNAAATSEPDSEKKRPSRTAAPPEKTKAAKKQAKPASLPSLKERIAEAKKLEAVDRAEPGSTEASQRSKTRQPAPAKASAAYPLRNSDFPNTYIKEISVKLDDPDHPVTLTWTGPQATMQERGPFRSSPGAGLKGLNCDITTTSRRSGSKCTPKGTFAVSGFQRRLNSDSRATYVTWFVRARGIALHYFPSVPKYAASHGCIRLETERIAQLIQNNSRIDLTHVVVDGTWTKPTKQW